MNYLLALDQGTSSSRAILFDEMGKQYAMAQETFEQHYPNSGWVEHEPMDLWSTQLAVARSAILQSGIAPSQIKAIGITNQRETTLLWEKSTGKPLSRAIVWQDRRTAAHCEELAQQGLGSRIHELSGLVLDPYFSASKIHWLLKNLPNGYDRARAGELAFGTVDTWLIYQLTGGKIHATDYTNASRTSLMNLQTGQWDPELLAIWGVPAQLLPEIKASSAHYGVTDPKWFGVEIPISGVAGDQQSALFGQACLKPGQAKNTYGTGCFILLNSGDKRVASQHGLISTAVANYSNDRHFAIEGSVFNAGTAVQWLRDGLKLIEHSSDIENLASQVASSEGVVMVPAFTGLGAPYWDPAARGGILGLTRSTQPAHIARAALESIALQSVSVLRAMDLDVQAAGGRPLAELRVDGGASVNNLLMQMQADYLGIPVIRPVITETTAWGAACLAGLHEGILTIEQLEHRWQVDRVFEPAISPDQAQEKLNDWEKTVKKIRFQDRV